MRFTDFLKATVLISAGAATALAAATLVGIHADQNTGLAIAALGWWLVAALFGAWLGRRAETNPPIARLLANARTSPALPELSPGRILLNRLWPLLAVLIVAGALAIVLPQVPGVAAGFALLLSLALRHQENAVSAIEERDGAAFYVEPTSPLRPIRLVRTPGLRRDVAPVL